MRVVNELTVLQACLPAYPLQQSVRGIHRMPINIILLLDT